MSMDQFVDLCILLGCDYCPTIRGIGPKKAFDLIVQYKSIENIIENIDQTVILILILIFRFFVFRNTQYQIIGYMHLQENCF